MNEHTISEGTFESVVDNALSDDRVQSGVVPDQVVSNQAGSETRKSPACVLVVEDENDLRFVLSVHLRANGFNVIEAMDGQTAVDLARDELPDMIIMDVGLPKMDGIAATSAIKADPQTASIPVIILTARTGSADVVRGFDAGAQEYLAKPFDIPELLARVQTVFKLSSARQNLDKLNQSLEQQVDLKTKRLQILYDFMRDLNLTIDREHVLTRLVQSTSDLTGAGQISVRVADAMVGDLICERSSDGAGAIRLIPAVHQDEEVASSSEDVLSMETSSQMISDAPMVSTSLKTENGVIGVLNVTEIPNGHTLAGEDIECIRSLADAAATALNNIQRRIGMEKSVGVLLRTVGHLAEYRDEETTQHLERVSIMAGILSESVMHEGAYASSLDSDFLSMIVQAAPMHDIGKVGIPDEILTKPGKLTDEEFQIMKTHTEIGRRVLSEAVDPTHPVPLLKMCIEIAHCHHERFDGKGYPRRMAGEEIPLAARIIALVDAYDAITSERRYSKARTHEQAVDIIRGDAGTHFDPVIVEAFNRCHQRFREISSRFEEAMA